MHSGTNSHLPQSIPQEKRRELTQDKTELKIVLNKELIKKLDKIKELMSHKNPNMTDQELIEVMASALLEKIDPAEKLKRSEIRKNKVQLKQSLNARILPTGGSKPKQNQKPPWLYPKPFPKNPILETQPEGLRPEGASLKNQQSWMSVSDRSPNPIKNERCIPQALKQKVYTRDQGKCTHPNCNINKFLEYDHIKP